MFGFKEVGFNIKLFQKIDKDLAKFIKINEHISVVSKHKSRSYYAFLPL